MFRFVAIQQLETNTDVTRKLQKSSAIHASEVNKFSIFQYVNIKQTSCCGHCHEISHSERLVYGTSHLYFILHTSWKNPTQLTTALVSMKWANVFYGHFY